ncbi:putative Histone acetylase complex subunit Paf400 [Taphrina deformans PYCC 5710]|uniref:Histone acetylase complex subunit Paf400 n=1 Tax=Taphrina deformans (strain PYCC 5710 / ATCC 11124 / CBS 356.35 / IMI 108563 / JCM 9778 / NBRC 8474) TaxID=1097556 RepID=R4XC05_TAPDE|nr:putative Histone acetylase complex subunit Paf400 [Taphrina deformans PYCC 5710]|eukprot:CCG81911.1 putative Histone acetylase complex subunit Paf400 [Taphrina deformans PYCC 5710]
MPALEDLSTQEPKAQLISISDFRSAIEATADVQATNTLQTEALPRLLALLRDTPACFSSLDVEQQVRLAAIETLHRFTFNESFKPLTSDLMSVVLELLKNDNEEIACVCLKVFIDLHKAYKTSIEEFVQPFLDIVLKLYQNMPETVRESFNNLNSSGTTATPSTARTTRAAAGNQSPQALNSPLPNVDAAEAAPASTTLNKSLYSFKVLTECPIIIVLLFSTYRQSVQTNLVLFTPAIIAMLSLQAPPAPKTVGSTTHASIILHRQVLAEFMLAQIKTLSFLAYVLRGFTAFMKKYAAAIPQFVLHLLNECPPEMSAARKELLVATRHILSTEFRNAFLGKIEVLLDENVLVGNGVTAREALR